MFLFCDFQSDFEEAVHAFASSAGKFDNAANLFDQTHACLVETR